MDCHLTSFLYINDYRDIMTIMISWIAAVALALAASEEKRDREISKISDEDFSPEPDLEDEDPATYIANVVHWWIRGVPDMEVGEEIPKRRNSY